MDTRAKIKHLRISAKKVRLATGFLKGMDVEQARHQLRFTTKASARHMLKLLNSAIANAEKNQEQEKDNLFIKDIVVDEGATLKRSQPRAFGRAGAIRKRSSHVTVVLGEKQPSKSKKKKTDKKTEKKEEKKVISYDEMKKQVKPDENKDGYKADTKESTKTSGRFKQIRDKFMRKTGEK